MSGPKLSLERFLTQLPSSVLCGGRVINIRSGVAEALQVGGALMGGVLVGVALTTWGDTVDVVLCFCRLMSLLAAAVSL